MAFNSGMTVVVIPRVPRSVVAVRLRLTGGGCFARVFWWSFRVSPLWRLRLSTPSPSDCGQRSAHASAPWLRRLSEHRFWTPISSKDHIVDGCVLFTLSEPCNSPIGEPTESGSTERPFGLPLILKVVLHSSYQRVHPNIDDSCSTIKGTLLPVLRILGHALNKVRSSL